MLHAHQPSCGDGSTSPVAGIRPADGAQRGLSELEERLAHQRRLLEEAAQYLHEAAYLARYHQPALERHIRAFLDELDA